MDLVQNGESSRSPRARTADTNIVNGQMPMPNGDGDIVMADHDIASSVSKKDPGSVKSQLVLPTWDVPPPKPLHSSLDLISLLHLDTLYNTYVRPFADVRHDEPNGPGHEQDDAAGDTKLGPGGKKGGMKRKKMEKGYQHLIEDCIDPTPMGTKGDNLSLLPLVPDYGHPPGPPPPLFPEGIEILPSEAFQVARLEPGTKQDGYANGVKVGVREAEEKRKKKRAAKMSIPPLDSGSFPSPGSGTGPGPHGLPSPNGPYPTSTPGTPLLPVAPPARPPFPLNTTRARTSTTPQPTPGVGVGVGVRPFPIAAHAGRPYAPYKRPGSAEVQSASKRVKSGSVGPSGTGGSNSRSASPMPQGQGPQGQRKMKPGMRSKTEGV